MRNPRWRKVLRDLWSNKARTILVVLSISVGVAAIGMITGIYEIITRELPLNYSRVNPASANIYSEPFDDQVVQVIRNMDDVRDAEGRYDLRVRMKIGPESWRDLHLYVLDDFNNILINKVWPETGNWPPEKGEVTIERASLPLANANLGDRILIETPNGRQKDLIITGLSHDINQPAGTFTNQVNGYITFETLELMGYPKSYNQLSITVDNAQAKPAFAQKIANDVADKIRKGGRLVYAVVISNPGRLWFEQFITPMTSILGILSIIILALSGLLVINTISALITQQIRQVGIMKAVGARTSQIFAMYIFYMVVIGLTALLLAMPLSMVLIRFGVNQLTTIINFDIANFKLPSSIYFMQLFLSLVVPIIAAMIPIISGVRVSVREAISDYGLTKAKFGMGRIDRIIGRVKGLPRPTMLSLRNTFRQKGRLFLTLLSLSIGSAIFIAVVSVYTGLNSTLDMALRYYNFDVTVTFGRPYRVEQIANEVKTMPGITTAETWDGVNFRIAFANGSESDNIILLALPPTTTLINPTLLQGRWLNPDDENALVINTDVLKYAPGVKVGDQISIIINDKKYNWNVVGIVRSVLSGPLAYTNYPYFSRILGRYGLAGAVYVESEKKDSLSQAQLAKDLESHFERAGLRVGSTSTVSDLRAIIIQQYNVIFIFLISMSVLLTFVGGLGLTGTMSLNVLERTREIGVMRAIGAANRSIMSIVTLEGILIGVMSWVIGLLIAVPFSWILGNALGSGFLQEPLRFSYSLIGAFFWLFVVIILAMVASYLPARNAVRLTVRDILAYE